MASPPGFRDAHGFPQQLQQHVQRQMFDYVERRDDAETCVRYVMEQRQGVPCRDIQSALVALLHHLQIRVDSAGTISMFTQQFQPFTPAAANVQGAGMSSFDRPESSSSGTYT